ncbi:MAG: class II fructose-bisphosphate aldolase [Lachnospiraceae bacterium]|nr:class II fructose-bisphosphate aldolase [Lachnospiraceae bacterium]
MLVNLKEILAPARRGKYAVGHFNTITLEMARAVIMAAKEQGMPVILAFDEQLAEVCPMDEFLSFTLPMAQNAEVPVAVHYDHGRSFDGCVRALKAGFTSVDYDCSEENFEDNVRKVAELTRIAHALGASVEAELGHVPDASELTGELDEDGFTLPDEAREYVKMTHIDALSIAVGTARGSYISQPRVDFDRIRAISEAADIPLTLHGGSGLSENAFRKAIASGVSKINILTDLNIAAAQGVIQAVSSGASTMTEIIPYMIYSVKVQAAEKIRLFKG